MKTSPKKKNSTIFHPSLLQKKPFHARGSSEALWVLLLELVGLCPESFLPKVGGSSSEGWRLVKNTEACIFSNQPMPGPLFNSKIKTQAPLFLGGVFFGESPQVINYINFHPRKKHLLGLNIRLSCLVVNLNFLLFVPSNSQGLEMGAKCSSAGWFRGRNLAFDGSREGRVTKNPKKNQLFCLRIWWKKQLLISKKHLFSQCLSLNFKKTWTLNASFIGFWRLRHAKSRPGWRGRETSEAAASELVTWPWSSSSSWKEKNKKRQNGGFSWGQIIFHIWVLNQK